MKPSRSIEELDSVNWTSLQHCYGPATSVPNALRDVASPEVAVYKEALFWLDMTICHQGSVYEATAAVVPFLFGLLQNPEVRCKKEILRLLAMISISYAHIHHRTFLFYEIVDFGVPPTDNTEPWVVTIKAARQAVRFGTLILLELLNHPEVEVRSAAIGVLACIKEESSSTLPIILDLSRSTSDEMTQASSLFALGSLSSLDTGVLDHLSEQLSVAESDLVRFAATVALSNLTGHQLPVKAKRVLRLATKPSEALAAQYRQLPWVQVWWDTEDIASVARDELALMVKVQ